MTELQLKVFELVRDRIEAKGISPSPTEIGRALSMTPNTAVGHLAALIRQGMLRGPEGSYLNLEIVGRVDLRPVGTEALRAELARRGVILDGLAQPPMPLRRGRPCTAEYCCDLVGPGDLFCRPHWRMISRDIQRRIFTAFKANDEDAYSLAIDEAKAEILDQESARRDRVGARA